MTQPGDRNQRNFQILTDRLSGDSYQVLETKYGLSRTGLHNIIKKQVAKVAEWDTEFQRRLSVLSEMASGSEDNAKRLAAHLQQKEVLIDVLQTRSSTDRARCKSLEGLVADHQESLRLQQGRIQQLESALASAQDQLRHSQNEAVKRNLKQHR